MINWINIQDQLPEIHQNIITCNYEGTFNIGYLAQIIEGELEFSNEDCYEFYNVEYWAPISEINSPIK